MPQHSEKQNPRDLGAFESIDNMVYCVYEVTTIVLIFL
jgi:hypothetical protein